MPSQISATSDLSTVAPLALDFAARCGMQVDPDAASITLPGGLAVTIAPTARGFSFGGDGIMAESRYPLTGTFDNPARRDLSKVYLFGSKPADAATNPF